MKIPGFTNIILHNYQLAELESVKVSIDKNVELINIHINFDFTPTTFFLEPDPEFYKKTVQQQAMTIQSKIGLSSLNCPIYFSGRGHLDTAAGRITEYSMPKPVFDMQTNTLRWGKNDIKQYKIEILDKFKNNKQHFGA